MAKRKHNPAKAVMAAIELRDHCRAYAAQRRQEASIRPALTRFTARAMTVLIFGGVALVVVLHAISLMR